MVAASRKRNAANSPSRVASPSRGTFTTSTVAAAPITNVATVRHYSPTPHNPRAAAVSRGRQNSTQSLKSVQDRARNPTSNLSNGKASGALKASTPELKTAAEVTSRTVVEARATLTDIYRNQAGERTLEEEGMSGALVVAANTIDPSQPTSNPLKLEEPEPVELTGGISTQPQPQPADPTSTPQSVPMTVTRSRNGVSKFAKSSTPNAAPTAASSDPAVTIPSMARSRSVRGVAATNSAPANSSPTPNTVGSPRRSHKRGAGTQYAHSLASPSRSSGSSVDGRNTSAAVAPNLENAPSNTTAPSARTTVPKQPSSRRSPQRRSGSPSSRHSSPPANDERHTTTIRPHGKDRTVSVEKPPPRISARDGNGNGNGNGNADIDPDGDGEGDAEGPSSPASDEPRYCVCGQVSYGDMIACDNTACPREWFHLQCVGLTKAPGTKAKWYCDECKEVLKRGGSVRG